MLSYVSTRGKAPRLGFAGATLAGLATDGGLYVPESCPKLSEAEIGNMNSQKYLEVAWRVILPFVSDDLPSEKLIELLRAAYKGFSNKEIAPLRKLDENFHVLELFHGPTLAFKDVALQFLGQIFSYFLEQKKLRTTIVGATSGDTGSAAIEAFRGKSNVDIFILHPHNRVSEVQRRQMTTVTDSNVHNIAIEGSFDDCQDLVKAMFNDMKFRNEVQLSAVNSINWARILAQVVYYVYAGARLFHETDRKVVFSVPTGNFGNVYAGYIAHSMGLPIERLLVATNRNDILHRFFTTGRMKMEPSVASLSPSMDIQVSSNFERLLFDLFGRHGDAVNQTMEHFRKPAAYHLEEPAMKPVRELFASGAVSDENTLKTIRDIHEKYGYVVDPHTAIGLAIAQKYRDAYQDSVIVSLATAHPAKFPDAVNQAIGVTPELPPHLADLMTRDEKFTVLPKDLGWVQNFVRQGVKGKLG
ncbi:MAG TPA: threonine synthase [Patescibacteria group bacterium]|nr:threonine synthase [Patescibacteria group bacterium]